jgi:AraC-like DNA-binding protein
MALKPIAVFRAPSSGTRRQALDVTEFGMHTITSQIVDRRLPGYAAVLIESGSGRLDTEHTGPLDVAGPSLFWLSPGTRHSYGPWPGTAWDERWVLFEGPLADEFRRLGLIDRAAPLVRIDDLGAVARLFSAIHSGTLDHGQLGRSACAATLYRLVVTVARYRARPPGEARTPDALRALQSRALEEIDLAGLAAEFGVSPATLRRHCVEAYGIPPKVLQGRLRLDRAKELLATSDQTIEAIAAHVGFSDAFYFSRVFNRREGCSPSTFRRLNRRG